MGFQRQAERGQLFPMLLFAVVIMLGFASLAIDVGYWRYQRGLQQNAADSAALAGAAELGYSTTLSNITAAAQADAATNGFANNGSTITVKVNNPPLSGNYTTNSQAVEVIVSVAQPVHLAVLLKKSTTVVVARAVAFLSSANRNCLFVFGTSSQSINLNGGTISMPGCGIVTNGGLLLNGGTVNASSIGYAAGASVTDGSTTFTTAMPAVSVPPVDPCGIVDGCAYLTANPPASTPCVSQPSQYTAPITISPGAYCSQVLFGGSGAITLSPGVYNFLQGATVNGGPTSMTGSGVTIYNQGTFIADPSSFTVTLSAPTTGNTAGVLFYQPASDTNQFILNGSGGGGSWSGMVYVPTGTIMVDGTPSLSLPLLVAGSITLNGSSGLSIPNSSFPLYGHPVLGE